MQTSRPKLRLALAGLAILGLAGGVSACGSSSGSDSATGPTDSATGTTTATSGGSGAAAPGAGATYSPGTSLSAAQVLDLMKNASTALTTAHIQMTMGMSSTGSITASGDISQNPLAEDMTMKIMGKQMEVRMVDQTMYMHMPGLTSGSSWMKMDLSAFSKLGMGSISSSITDPMGMLDDVSKAVSQATYVGPATVNGQSLDHYRLSLDSKKVMSVALPSGTPSDLPGVSMPKQVTEDVYLDSRGRMSKASVDMGSLGTVSAVLSDFGEKVDVAKPPADQTKDMTDMLSQMGGSLSSLGG